MGVFVCMYIYFLIASSCIVSKLWISVYYVCYMTVNLAVFPQKITERLYRIALEQMYTIFYVIILYVSRGLDRYVPYM